MQASTAGGRTMMGEMHALRSFTTPARGAAGGAGGAHQHDENCQHGQCGPSQRAPDVSTGRGDKMDR